MAHGTSNIARDPAITFELADWLSRYTPFDDLEAQQVKQLEQFLQWGDNHFDRGNLVAHIIADPWIVNQDQSKVLLMNHAYKGKWLTPGGHCDGSADVLTAALREANEETGLTDIQVLTPNIFDINCGYVPFRQKAHGAEPLHLHFDICFLLQADEHAPLTLCDEGTELRWIPFDLLDEINMFDEHRRRGIKSLQRWGFPD